MKPPSKNLSEYTSKVMPFVITTIENLGLNLVKLSFVYERNTNYLRITIYNPQGSTTIEDCEKVSREVENKLDTKDLIPFPYILEVESPGIGYQPECKNTVEFEQGLFNVKGFGSINSLGVEKDFGSISTLGREYV